MEKLHFCLSPVSGTLQLLVGGGGLRAQDGSVRGQEGESHGLAFVLILQQEKGNEATLASLGWMWKTRPAIHNLKI